MLFVIFSSILLNMNPVNATTAPEFVQKKVFEVPFYKSSNSLFPSGSTNIENLKKQLVSTKQKADKHYKWNKLNFSRDEIKPLFATHLSRYVVDPKTNTRLKVIEANVNSLQLFDIEKKILIKKNINEVQADAYDLGFVMTLKDVYLKAQAQEQALIQTTIPQGTRLNVEKYVNEFALVKYQNYEGYVNLSELITKIPTDLTSLSSIRGTSFLSSAEIPLTALIIMLFKFSVNGRNFNARSRFMFLTAWNTPTD